MVPEKAEPAFIKSRRVPNGGINGMFPIRRTGFSVCLMKKHRSALMILRVRDQTAAGGNGSLVEVELLYSRLCFKPENLRAKYDLASLGEVESMSRPAANPPKWTMEYKERVSVKPGALSKAKA
jgi:hypothetical protein